jgi:hypothetical protein
MYLVPHTKGDLDNHANQLNPNNPRYAGHQERIAAAEASREAAALHQKAQAAYQYANKMEAGRFFLYFYYEMFFLIISLLAAMQAQAAAGQLSQQATLCAQQASMGLNTREGMYHFCLNFTFILYSRRTWSWPR